MTNFVAVGTLVLCLSSALRAQTKAQQGDSQRTGAQTRLSPEDEKGRKKILAFIEENPFSLADWRQSCADGKEVGKVREDRAHGVYISPDASETCPLVIERQAHNGTALDYYGKLVADGGGSVSPQQALKNTGAAAMSNQTVVPIGNARGFKLTNAIAWDAGEVVGASDSSVTMQSLGLPVNSTANETKINQTAEACLDANNPSPPPATACFTAGLVKAVMDRQAVARK